MNTTVAEAVARGTRQQAVHDARQDLWELRRRAVEAGRDRSRQIIKTSRIDTRTGELRYNPAGRLLRDWYFHVYLNTLRHNLGEPAVTIDAQQIEDNAARLHLIRPSADGLATLRAVGVVRNVAVDDAAHAAADILGHLATAAARRAVLHAGDYRFDGDQLAIHLTRHWYQHCYDDHVHGATRSRHPLAEVTDGQEREVVKALATGEMRRIVGTDGIPLVTAQGTTLTPVERDLAAGLAGLVPPITPTEHHTHPTTTLRSRVTRTWSELGAQERVYWLHLAGAHREANAIAWSDLPGATQTKIIRLYLNTHRPDQVAVPFVGERINSEPETAAISMFNHHRPLKADGASAGDPIETAVVLGDDHLRASQVESQGHGRSQAR